MNDGARTANEEEPNEETGRELNGARPLGHSSFVIDSLSVISSFSRMPQCL
jgi:hypothetical protein